MIAYQRDKANFQAIQTQGFQDPIWTPWLPRDLLHINCERFLNVSRRGNTLFRMTLRFHIQFRHFPALPTGMQRPQCYHLSDRKMSCHFLILKRD